MTRDISKLLTSEMTAEEWKEFRQQWADGYATEMMLECGMELADAERVSNIRFEDYCGQEGYTMRNEMISMKRDSQHER